MIRAATAAALLALVVSGCATMHVPERPDTVSLGHSAAGEPCVATRNWRDPAVPDAFARSYAITCQGVAASRPLGAIRIVPSAAEALAPLDAVFTCGVAREVTVAGRRAQVRRCFDRTLSTATIRLDVAIGTERLVADATPALLAELEEAVAILTGARPVDADAGRTVVAGLDAGALPPGPPGLESETLPVAADPAAVAGIAGVYDPTAALAEGINRNHKGLHVEASRILNDALSRLPESGPESKDAAVRVELLLEAGLADSNIRFGEAATDHFAQADRLMAQSPGLRTPFLLRKRDSYLALDAVNRHQFREALTLLDGLARAPTPVDQPLKDPATLRLLNQPRARPGTAASSISLPDAADLTRLVIDAQVNWARSVALASLNDPDGAMAAIIAAADAYRPLGSERIDQAEVLWLGARIERQRGRLLARRGQVGPAIASFDRAVDDLQRSAASSASTGGEASVAGAQLERASLRARSGVSHREVRVDFGEAVDALIASGNLSLNTAPGMEDYLDLLVDEAGTKALPDTYERFFRAVQATGEPAIARQLNQLQTVVGADPELGGLLRERANLERDITRYRYALTAPAEPDQPSGAALVQARTTAEQRLLAVDARLARDPRYRTVDERPATLMDLKRALRPGEAYFKVSETGRRIYGLFVTADRTAIYAIAPDAATRAAVDQLANEVRASIDGRIDEGQLEAFDEARAYALFRVVSGPVSTALASASALVVDPSGPLERLPLGVLVTRYDKDAVRPAEFDFSQTAFLAAGTTISTALSPRSFLVARALPPSRAAQPFLGLGEHVPARDASIGADARPVQVGYGCTVSYGRLAALSRQLQPISSAELRIAADAIGAPRAPMMTDATFSDTGVEARDDLAQYQVLHFATHGLQEGQWGCSKSPPALVTSFGGNGSDGLLSFSEIAALRLDANLVVLSACDTASGVKGESLARLSGQEEAGSTLEGLVRAFLTANARAVLATYWQVSAERDNREFIRTFYASARTKPIGVALQDAQRDLMRQPVYSHPFYWAPYFVVGDSTKPMLSGTQQQPLAAR